jgi:hypothetical protein
MFAASVAGRAKVLNMPHLLAILDSPEKGKTRTFEHVAYFSFFVSPP